MFRTLEDVWDCNGNAVFISDNQRSILELAILSGKLFFWRCIAKSGLRCCTEAGMFPCLQLVPVCQARDMKKARGMKTTNLCQKTRNLTCRATFMKRSRDRVGESPKRSALGIAQTVTAVTPPGQQHSHAEPHQKCEEDFSHGYNL